MVAILLCGVPGSGKSTYILKTLKSKYTEIQLPVHVVSPDHYLMVDGKYVWTPERSAEAWDKAKKRCKEITYEYDKKIRENVGSTKPPVIIFDATFVAAKARKPIIKMFVDLGYTVECHFLDTPFSVCEERNNKRSEDRRVPKSTMEAMRDRWELPALSEGFIRTYRVVDGKAEIYESR